MTHRNKKVEKCVETYNSFKHYTETNEVPVLVFRDENSQRWTLTFWVDQDECPSGYCLAFYANYELKKETIPFDEVPVKQDLFIYIQKDNSGSWRIGRKPDFTEADNNVFSFSQFGEDEYYPTGSYKIKAKFQKTARSMKQKPVWIFMGSSGSGKSTLAHETKRLVYETDSSASLPNLSNYDIIVVGNRFRFNLDEIKKHLPKDTKIIVVNFNS